MLSVLYRAFHPTIKAKSPNAKISISPEDVRGTEGCVGALAHNVVMLDIDNAQDLAAFDRVLDYVHVRVPTMITPHGKHFYFLANEKVVESNFTRGLLACGVVADVKVGAKNGFDCVKQMGDLEWRKWENEDAQLIPFPAFCKPVLKGNKAQEQGSFTQSHEGSRNDKLFSFITALKNGGFDYKSTLALCRMINRVVMSEPLDDTEVQTICRPEAYQSAYMNHQKKTKMEFDLLKQGDLNPSELDPEILEKLPALDKAEMILAMNTLRLVDGNLYVKEGHVWKMAVNDRVDINREIIKLFPTLNMHKLAEVRSAIEPRIAKLEMDKEQHRAKDLIPFANGVYNIEDGTLKAYSEYEDYYFFRQVPHDYVKNPKVPEILENFLECSTSGDRDIRTMLLEMAGACFHDDIRLRGCFILVGDKAKGKSTFLNFLRNVNGLRNSAAVKIHEFLESFMLSNLLNKTANFGDDIAADYIKETSVLKSIITGDNVTVNVKYHKPVTTHLTATQVFTANALPRFTDPSGALMSRIKLIPFKASFTKPDVFILDKLDKEEVYSAFIYMALEAYRAALQRGAYTEAASAKVEMESYKDYNADSVTSFLRDEYDNDARLLNMKSVGEIYPLYVQYCEEEQIGRIGKNVFASRVLLAMPQLDKWQGRHNGRRAVGFRLKQMV